MSAVRIETLRAVAREAGIDVNQVIGFRCDCRRVTFEVLALHPSSGKPYATNGELCVEEISVPIDWESQVTTDGRGICTEGFVSG